MVRYSGIERPALIAATLGLLAFTEVGAQELGHGDMALKTEGHSGVIYPESDTELAVQLKGSLRFEPVTMLGDLYRKDIVLLMRHGPTDWSQMDVRGVHPKDCARQRMLTPAGRETMRQLGKYLAVSEILPTEIRFSPWCRNSETFETLMAGILSLDPEYDRSVEVAEDYGLGLLLSLGGAATVVPIIRAIEDWKERGPTGPLLLITHYTNIEELTDFRVYEGEILVLDPALGNRVLGYLRMDSARPDTIHFDVPDIRRESN